MRNLKLGLLLVALAPAAAGAAVEVTLTAGQRWGEASVLTEARSPFIVCITTPCILAEGRGGEDESLGLLVDIPVARRWMVEVLYNQQDGDLEMSSLFPIIDEHHTYDAQTAQVGMLRHWRDQRLKPFVAAGVGLTRFETTALAYDRPVMFNATAFPVDEEALSASLAGGVKAGLTSRLALRLEGRYHWIDFPERLGGSLGQTEASIGLSVRI